MSRRSSSPPSGTMPLETVHRIEEAGFASREASHAEMHNVYGMLNSRATYEGLLELASDRRPFVLTRASFSGGQRYAATWTGDNTSSWEHLQLSVSMLANLGLSGFAYSGDDIGGFTGPRPSPELLTRWIEIGAFNPLFRIHSDKLKESQEVWTDGVAHEAIRRRFIEERYRLMPYVYAIAEENSRTGIPILRPVFLEFPATVGKGWRLGGTADQFMLGGRLLVAPPAVWESPAAYAISLPETGWYDYWSGRRLDAATTTEVPRIDHLPVFVRPGSIIPRQPLVQSTMEVPVGPLELAVYPGPDCQGSLYLDDGSSFRYLKGEYLRQVVRCEEHPDSLELIFAARDGRYVPWWTEFSVVIHGWTSRTRAVTVAGTRTAARYDDRARTLTFRLPDQPLPSRITVPRAVSESRPAPGRTPEPRRSASHSAIRPSPGPQASLLPAAS